MKYLTLAIFFLVACTPLTSSAPLRLSESHSLNLNLPTHASITALALAPRKPPRAPAQDPRIIFAGAYDKHGLYLSRDAGTTWTLSNHGIENLPVYSLLMPGDTPRVLAGTSDGLYVSDLVSASFKRAESLPGVNIYALAETDTGEIFAATDSQGLYHSADGENFSPTPGLDGEILLAVAARDARTIFVGTSGHGLFITRDAGAHWEQPDLFRGTYVSLVSMGPSANSPTLFVRTREAVYRSDDEGETWTPLRGEMTNQVVTALDFSVDGQLILGMATNGVWQQTDESHFVPSEGLPHGIAVTALAVADAETIYASTYDRVYRSDDGGKTFHVSSDGIGSPSVHQIVRDPTRRISYAATDDGLFAKGDGEAQWTRLANNISAPILSVALAPSNTNRIYVGTSHLGVFISADGGKNFTPAGGDLGGRLAIPGIVVDPHDAAQVFARVLYERVYKSSDGGDSWRAQWEGMSDATELVSLALDPNDSRNIFAGATNGIYFTATGSAPWRPSGLDGETVFAILIESDLLRVFAGATDGLFLSRDRGNSWERIGLSNLSVTTIARDPQKRIIVGTKDHGLYVSADEGTTWNQLHSALDGESIDSLVADGDAIFMSTPAGIWNLKLSDAK